MTADVLIQHIFLAGYETEPLAFGSPYPVEAHRPDFASSEQQQQQQAVSANRQQLYGSLPQDYGLSNGYRPTDERLEQVHGGHVTDVHLQQRPDQASRDGIYGIADMGGGYGVAADQRPDPPLAPRPLENGGAHVGYHSDVKHGGHVRRQTPQPSPPPQPPRAEERLDGKEFFRRYARQSYCAVN